MALVDDEIDYIDPGTKTIHFKGGWTAPLGDEAAFELEATPAEKKIRKSAKEGELAFHKDFSSLTGSPSVNSFIKNAGTNLFTKIAQDYVADPARAALTAFTVGEGQEDQGYFSRLASDYAAQRMGRREAVDEISRESPKAALLGKAASLGIDVGVPLGSVQRSPMATGALFGAASTEKSLIEDPTEVLKGGVVGAGIGYGVGRFGESLERVATERRLLREFPELERQAAREYSQQIVNFRRRAGDKLQALERDISKYGIPKSSIALDEFINREIGVSRLSGTAEGREVENFLRSVDKSLPQELKTSDVQKLFETIEIRAQEASELQAPIYQAFKSHLVEQLPIGASETKLMGQIFPKVEKEVMKVYDQVFSRLPKNVVREIEKTFSKNAVSDLRTAIRNQIRQKFQNMSPQEFVGALERGDTSIFLEPLLNSETYMAASRYPEYLADRIIEANPTYNKLGGSSQSILSKTQNPLTFEVQTRFQDMPNILNNRLQGVINKNAIDASIVANEVQQKVASKISNAVGVQNPFTNRPPTNLRPPPYQPPSPPQVGGLARRFETTRPSYSRGGATAAVATGLGKLIGLPKLGAVIGGAKALQLGLEGTLRGITSPTALGNIARSGMREGGSRYLAKEIASLSSYSNGVIRDPNERKMMVAEIEQNPDIPLEDKAVFQSYINRGKSIEQFLENY